MGYYPFRLVHNKVRLQRFVDLAKAKQGVTFVGCLGTYRYLDIHITIAEALDAAEQFLTAHKLANRIPTFCIDSFG